MSSEGENDPASLATPIGNDANTVCTRRKMSRSRYPGEWRDCCRDIYAEYQRYLTRRFGEFKWDKIRNLIMRDFDEKLGRPDTRLSRQDLEGWIKRDVEIGDEKFAFVDLYLHKELLRKDSDFTYAAQRVIAYRETHQIKTLRALYWGDRRSIPKELFQFTDKFTEALYITDRTAKDSSAHEEQAIRCAIYVRPHRMGRYLVSTVFQNGPGNTSFDINKSYFGYFGYLVPIAPFGGGVYCVLQLFDRAIERAAPHAFHNTSEIVLTPSNEIYARPVFSVASAFSVMGVQSAIDDGIVTFMRSGLRTAPDMRDNWAPAMPIDEHCIVFTKVNIDEVTREYMNSLRDQYLLW